MIPVQPISQVDHAAERRPLSIVYCDLVGSTEIASEWDPEDVREVYGRIATLISGVSESLGGFVAEFPGDAALVYFGYPQANENDAECAIRAALQIVEEMSSLVLLHEYCPKVRIGIATGLVVVGATEGAGVASLRHAAGQTPNLAARMQQFGQPGDIIIDDTTRKFAGRLFEYEDLGPRSLKGFAELVHTWQVLGPAFVESRFEAQRGSQLTPLVGRSEEQQRLQQLWRESANGSGRVVLITGEAGFGKSRLAASLLESLVSEPHVRLRYFCSPHLRDSPLHPCIQQLERAARFARSDSPEQKMERLRASLVSPRPDDLALISELLAIPNSGTSLRQSPQQRKDRTLDALLWQLEALSQSEHVLVVFEDAHWSDPTSLELLDRVVPLIARRPVMLIVTCRPELDFSWAHAEHVWSCVLNPLPRHESALLIERIAGQGRLHADIVRDVVDRTDGVPLYIEEMTRAILDAQEDGAQGVLKRMISDSSSIPAPLHGPLLSRLDRLGSARAIAELAAALGREFSLEMLAAVSAVPAAELQAAIDKLVRSGLLIETSAAAHPTYVFKHVLVQDAAYQTMLRATRQKLHGRIVSVLETEFPDAVKLQPEVIARHCSEANLIEKAITYWLQAGYRAMLQWAMVEAIARLERGLALVRRLPRSDQACKIELDFELALGKALIATKGYADEATGAVFSRAHELCVALNNPPQVLAVLYGQWTHVLLRGDMRAAKTRAAQMVEQGEVRADHFWSLTGCRLSGVTCFPIGAFEAGRRQLEKGLAMFDPERRAQYAAFTVDDPRVIMQTYLAYLLLGSGDVDQARKHCAAALNEALGLAQPYTIAHALIGATYIELYLGFPQRAEDPLTRLMSLAAEQHIAYYAAFGTLFRGLSLLIEGEAKDAIAWLDRGLSAYQNTSSSLYLPSFLMWRAAAHQRLGHYKRGLEIVDEALEIAHRTEMRNDLVDMHRLRAELLLDCGDSRNADASFELAIDTARIQGAKLAGLKAASSYATRLAHQGKRLEARQLLAPIHQSMVEGHDLRPYTDVSALLRSLQ